MLTDEVLSDVQEDALISFFERHNCRLRSEKEKGASAGSQLAGKSGKLKKGEKRVQLLGVVKKVLYEKSFGFIQPLDSHVSEPSVTNENEDEKKDVYFHFDKVRGYLFTLKRGDTVQFCKVQSKNNKISAVNVMLIKPVQRSADELLDYLDTLDDELTAVKEDGKPSVNVIQIVGSPVIWKHLSEMINTLSNDDVIYRLFEVVNKLSKSTKSLDESFKQMLFSLTGSSLFNPFNGRLKETIKNVTNTHTLSLIQDVLLLIVRHVPDKIQAVIALVKHVIDKGLECNLFLFSMLKAVARLTSSNIYEMEWQNMPLIMTTEEVHSVLITDQMNLQPVKCQGPYASPNDYMETYFRLLRTDCFSSLKKGIKDFLCGNLDPRDMKVYVNVMLCGIEVRKDDLYLALKVTPQQKVKDWDNSRNLMFGNLLCISVGGKFNNLIWATVADRSLLKRSNTVMVQTCNEFNVCSTGEVITDMLGTGIPIIMAESPTYYRAYKPVLKALQAIEPEEMSFRDELVSVKRGPVYFPMEEKFDASLVYKDCRRGDMISIKDFIETKYDPNHSIFDKSQEKAVKTALKSNIGIIQGPPGSGKSFIGVQMLRILLSMPFSASKKVLILTYKNHALDEFVKSALKHFPETIVRVGGRSSDKQLDAINLKNVTRTGKKCYDFIDMKNSIYDEINQFQEDIEAGFDALDATSTFSYDDVFSQLSAEQQFNIIKYCDWGKSSLKSFGVMEDGFTIQKRKGKNSKRISSKEVEIILRDVAQHGDKIMKLADAAFKLWVPVEQVFSNEETRLTGNANLEIRNKIKDLREIEKEADAGEKNNHNKDDFFDEEELKELEEERKAALSSFRERSPNETRNIHVRKDPVKSPERIYSFSKAACRQLLQEGYEALIHHQNLWDLTPQQRVCVMQYFALKKRESVCQQFEENTKLFDDKVKELEEINNTITSIQLEDKQIIAMTITGASIHNTLLKEIQPSIVIIEEAAEILEPQLVAAIGTWTEYLLMIGDHCQLRPSVETYELRRNFQFDVSMMERLINNAMLHTTLAMQNRQRAEFAELLLDIYPKLKTNHERVKNNHPAPCLVKSSFFWHHDFPESKERSVTNKEEGDRAVMLALFLMQQGIEPRRITILAMYQGQTTLIRKCLKQKLEEYAKLLNIVGGEEDSEDNKVVVHTVDMYQGDENDIVIVSMVRSNSNRKIGFVGERNRRCVAQSRARCGVYFVGNATMFSNHPTWRPIMEQLSECGRIGSQLEIKCQHHPNVSLHVNQLSLQRFCNQPCMLPMSCHQHNCNKACQPPHNHHPCHIVIPFTHTICGHQGQRKCCEDPDKKRCSSTVKFTFPKCGHAGQRKCFEDQTTVICIFEERVKLPCLHIKPKKCNENVNDIKCTEICALKLKCGHQCQDHQCYQHATVKTCNTCEKIKKAEAERLRKVEEELRRKANKAIEEELKVIREKAAKQGDNVDYTPLVANGATATEYLDVEDSVKKFIQPFHQWYPNVTKIVKVTNYKLKIKFMERKRTLFDPEGRSVLKFHGTGEDGVEGITKSGFRLPTGGNPMYGFGIYFASDASKSAQEIYTKGSNKLLLCEVLMGKSLTVESAQNNMTLAELKKRQCDSLFAKRDTKSKGGVLFDEFVVYDPDQAYPKYIIHYTKAGVPGNPALNLRFGTNFDTGHKEVLPTRTLKVDDPLDVHFRIAESQFLRLLNNLGGNRQNIKVAKIDVYMNPKLQQKFDLKLQEFQMKYKKTPAESEYLMLFHGTKSRDIVKNIMDNNFIPSVNGKFGPGVYFSEFPAYTFGYGGMSHLIIAKVLPGRVYRWQTGQHVQPYDSIGALQRTDGRYSEIVITNTDQILPCYVVHIGQSAVV